MRAGGVARRDLRSKFDHAAFLAWPRLAIGSRQIARATGATILCFASSWETDDEAIAPRSAQRTAMAVTAATDMVALCRA
jgi:hypothetical protein